MTKILPSLVLLCALSLSPLSFAGDQESAVATVQDFYTRYLAYDHARTPTLPPPAMAFSKTFQAEINKTAAACRKYGEGPCGWAASGDEYLDAQEIDPGLTYANSGISITEIAPGQVQVRLNVYPSQTDAGDYYLRTITYRMLKQHGAYVVDDIAYADDVSARKSLVDERKQLYAQGPKTMKKSAVPAKSLGK